MLWIALIFETGKVEVKRYWNQETYNVALNSKGIVVIAGPYPSLSYSEAKSKSHQAFQTLAPMLKPYGICKIQK